MTDMKQGWARAAAAPPGRDFRHEDYIEAAWRRCRDEYGLNPEAPPAAVHVGGAALRRIREEHALFERLGRVEMHRLLGQIGQQTATSAAPSRYVLMLTDADGTVLDVFTDTANAGRARAANMVPGFLWDEPHAGVNGPGTSLHDRRSRVVHRDEHFFTCNNNMTCSAVPVWGANGRLLGAIDATCLDCDDSRAAQVPTIALVSMSARIIEQLHFTNNFRDCMIMRFHERPELVGLPYDSLLAVDGDGLIRAVDNSVPAMLGASGHETLVGRSVAEVFDISLDRLLEHAETQPFAIWPIAHGNDRHGFASVWPAKRARARLAAGATAQRRAIEVERPARTLPAMTRPRRDAPAPLAALAGTDPAMAHNVWRAERVMNRDINILLLGETGTGKDTFARAIHAASARGGAPFIAMSCAAIPEQLIESELFGYEAGAFTGARPGGARGKAAAAHGGTLFLDEIGDMPLTIQARLLRLLEEREIVPLGSTTPIRIDIRVISATHRDLEAMVARGEFRMDLYYRLNGVALTMPGLRERADRQRLIETICAEESEDGAVGIAPAAMAAMTAYDWPGNIRELRNTLRTAIAFADSGRIEVHHLPHMIVRQMGGPAATPQVTVANPDHDPGHDPDPSHDPERARIVAALDAHHWRIGATAASLGMSRNTLYRKLHRFGLMNEPK
ncbi:MAG TPA: sigma-54-dependent Fis family transcriptional regulator [Acidiphilium sp.]|uniref:sigma-54-dependent Fis family transcriptional regulator n=1 Tax=unclassified Acidiphilium TaxID=2617493 RepID=UPI000BD0E4A2|nr:MULTISPECIES: sigma-54-dependent Fis family transcriptional regulator [unclassified Acidiphilium]OYV56618.1 MAG: AAA family ATPase [Acidiphilium sp. 20-67-58]HQT62261.1 sigma-54-dependent Fis family transcriptional regulator [Acidiphilium sp.]HQU11166.1 sigma-54-dependent Fis family transcriptional regulator [Acidiphilium sp.]